MVAAPTYMWPCHRIEGRMHFRATSVALVVSAIILLLCQSRCYPPSSDLLDLTAMSEPVTFKQFICCNCHGLGDARIRTTFFGTRRAVELHISRSRACKAAGKGVSTATMVYRESKRAEDQEAGAVGAPGQWPVRPAGGSGAAGKISTPISYFLAQYRKNADIGILRY